ncbi:endonuclease/exonuclease/phosphatase family protein [Streptomyces sp. NPDC047725]|uniref:endonuclease/exonuclease/phosphatase family protein n=1 Tax=Streptomyces sp. NPDC047725 TaxID=3365487 RepID=UPI00371048DB
MRVVTWNLWWRFGPWAERRKAILAVLRELDPDVVGLQEVWATDEDNLAGWLAGELGLHWTWAASPAPGRWQRRIGDGSVGIGTAVLSRRPVVERAVLRLPVPAELDDGRLALYARVDAPAHPVPFFTAHLTSASGAATVRREQAAALARFVAEHGLGTAHPPVVTGDFNARPHTGEVRLLRTAGLYDAWDHADPAAPGGTWDTANPYVTRADGERSIRIDYVHVGPPGPGGAGRVRTVRRAGAGPVDGVWPSDHAAVVADLDDGVPAAPPGTP